MNRSGKTDHPEWALQHEKIIASGRPCLGALATPTYADIVLNPTQVGQSGVVNYNGIVDNTVVPGLSASIKPFTLQNVDLATNTWSFGFALDNTSSGAITSSRVSTFGFNTDPALNTDPLLTKITGGTVFTGVSSGNVPMQGSVDFCGHPQVQTARVEAGDGVLPGDGIVTGSFNLDFAGAATNATQISFTDLYVRYQSIVGTTLRRLRYWSSWSWCNAVQRSARSGRRCWGA